MRTRPTQGTGAAHIGYPMFAARTLLLQAVPGGGAGGGGAGGQPPGAGAPPPAPTPAAAAPPTPAPAAQPQAQGGAPAADELRLAEQRGRDSAYAELRRSGALKRSAIEAIDAR